MKFLTILSAISLVVICATDIHAEGTMPLANLGTEGCPGLCEAELTKLTKNLNISCDSEEACKDLSLKLTSANSACGGCKLTVTLK